MLINRNTAMQKPKLVVVTGRPGSGKTTLSTRLSKETGLPLLSRDHVKQALLQRERVSHDELPDANKTASELFFSEVDHHIESGKSLIIEAAFQHNVWEPQIDQWSKHASVRLVLCEIDASIARDRYNARLASDPNWEHIHGTGRFSEVYRPPHMDLPTVSVDTTNGYRPTINELIAKLT